ncbi:MAG TPA: DEAD/DEAH box helicase family protein, partial [Methanosarcina sp.]|nr:DEAD/DEAH box helicase family protein [Methanosarcina sp.]
MSETAQVEQVVQAKADVMSFFPLETPRKAQELVIREVAKAFEEGKRFVILEAPVGSGKSAKALTLARWAENAHIITPRKSLQDQYFDDFGEHIVLMKGRNAYPCTFETPIAFYRKTVKAIKDGRVKSPAYGEEDCASAPCRNSEAIWRACTTGEGERPCPYQVAMETAQDHSIVVHNIHSFIFQTNFGGKFDVRKLLIVDEAHEIENVIRGFITKKFSLKHTSASIDTPTEKSLDAWCDFFLEDNYVPQETDADRVRKSVDDSYQSERDQYINKVEQLRTNSEYYGEQFTVASSDLFAGPSKIGTTFEFIPHSIGSAAHKYLFNFGENVLLMSGTIYDKDMYCKCIGVNPADAYFIRVPSSFPVENRPIYLKPDYQVDTSHRSWQDNFGEMVEKIKKIMSIFKDVKGLIHAPSYDSMYQIAAALGSTRVVTHDKGDLQQKLDAFYASSEPLVFISPVCQQGVDFKGDRGRFQIVLRVPYPNTS